MHVSKLNDCVEEKSRICTPVTSRVLSVAGRFISVTGEFTRAAPFFAMFIRGRLKSNKDVQNCGRNR